MSIQGIIICDTHLLVSDVYSSNLYKEVLNMESLYRTVEPNSICVIVEPPLNLEHNFNKDGREHNYENSMYIWIQKIIIPKLNPKTTLSVNRDVPLQEFGDKTSKLINSIQQKNYA